MNSDERAVQQFSFAMAEKLTECRNHGKKGWEKCSPGRLYSLLLREVAELGVATLDTHEDFAADDIEAECVDVANFAMFLWSVVRTRAARRGRSMRTLCASTIRSRRI